MSSVTTPQTLPLQPKKVGLGRSILWSLGAVAAVPVAVLLAWLVGLGGSKTRDLVDKLNITWGQVWVGVAIVAGYAVIVGIVHGVRTIRARQATYTTVLTTLAPSTKPAA